MVDGRSAGQFPSLPVHETKPRRGIKPKLISKPAIWPIKLLIPCFPMIMPKLG